MKNFITVLFLTAGLFLNAQYYSITYIQVPVDKQAEVARLETQYWSKVAKANIDEGKQLAWGLFARVGGSSETWTHAFVNVYETIDQMMDPTIWNPEKILGISASEIVTNTMYSGSALHHWKIQDQIPGENTDFSIWNYGRPNDLGGFVRNFIAVICVVIRNASSLRLNSPVDHIIHTTRCVTRLFALLYDVEDDSTTWQFVPEYPNALVDFDVTFDAD